VRHFHGRLTCRIGFGQIRESYTIQWSSQNKCMLCTRDLVDLVASQTHMLLVGQALIGYEVFVTQELYDLTFLVMLVCLLGASPTPLSNAL